MYITGNEYIQIVYRKTIHSDEKYASAIHINELSSTKVIIKILNKIITNK